MAGKEIPNEARAAWLRVRAAWGRGSDVFSSTMSMLSQKENEQLYDIVRHAIYKDNYVQVLREKPELKGFLKGDEDRLCMMDIYQVLSYRLRRSEPPPKTEKAAAAMNAGIGRNPAFGY
ncbi:MAG: hypothetical protein PHV13_05135 [Candidatus ainarchaeum sp.]|nr:hypothetical protein [Candidatus ainarchaeum sp.]